MVTLVMIYTDQNGHIPVTYSKKNKYFFVIYHHNANSSITEPLKGRTEN